jgi:LmbE family N-acetylglucosaminyl deacetylase
VNGPDPGRGLEGLNAGGRLLVVSPHLDDAVLSCAGLLRYAQNATVVTIFAGDAPAEVGLTTWDRDCGFGPGDAVMEARRQEDARALAHLRVRPVWLTELQENYRNDDPPPEERIADHVREAITTIVPTHVAIPLGIWHRDHLLTARAARVVLREQQDLAWFFYADQPYAHKRPWALWRQLLAARSEGIRPRRAASPRVTRHGDTVALQAYATQLRGLHLSVTRLRWIVQKYWTVSIP